MTPDRKFLDTIFALRSLLDRVYDTSKILDFHTLVEEYVNNFTDQWDILFYIKERKWFIDEKERSDNFLKFNFLSFERNKSELVFFPTNEALVARENQLLSCGYQRILFNKCAIIIPENPNASEADLAPLINLTKRIFVSFYRNCGPYEHFRESVALRFAREFHKSVGEINEDTVTNYIRESLDLNLEILHQRDELYFRSDAQIDQLVVTPTKLLPTGLKFDRKFRSAFRTSVVRKNQTFGTTENRDFHFAVVTHNEEYFVYNEELLHRTIKQRPKFAIVYFSTDKELDIEEIFHATKIISLFLHFAEIHDRESLLSFYSTRALELEEEISEKPIQKRSDLEAFLISAIDNIFSFVTRITDAQRYDVYLFEPHTKGIRLRLSSNSHSQDLLLPLNSDAPHCVSYLNCREIDIWHPDKIRQDIDERPARPENPDSPNLQVTSRWLDDSLQVAGIGSEHERAVWICPIVKGRTPIGVVEFSSDAVSRLSPGAPVFRTAVELAGEISHRIELANDRGWLTRLSFIQVARHRIENVVDKVMQVDRTLGEKLQSSFYSPEIKSVAGSQGALSSSSELFKYIKEQLIEREVLDEVPEDFWNKFHPLEPYLPVSTAVARAVIDVLETILSNSSHSPFQYDGLSVRAGAVDSEFPYLEIEYFPTSVLVPREIAERCCTAPIERPTSPTYHIGLFLCGTQLRMIGGSAYARYDEPVRVGNSPFGLTFQIPLRTRRIAHDGAIDSNSD